MRRCWPSTPDLAALLSALAEHPLVAGLSMGGVVAGSRRWPIKLAYLLPFSIEQKLQLLQLDAPLQRLELIQHLLDRMQAR